MRNSRLGFTLLALLVLALNAFAVDGVAVSVHSSSTNAFGHHVGNIERFIITNNVPDGGTVIYSASNGQRARCVSISPRGNRVAFIREDGKVCIKSNEAGGAVSVLANIPNNSWIDWPTEDYVYYVNAWQGNELWRVNTSGTPNPQRVATGLHSAMQFSLDTNLTRGTAVTCCYSARSFTLSGSSITLNTDNGGCGAGISPSGNYFTNNQSDHASVKIRNFNGSLLYAFGTSSCSGAGTNWNRNRWSANSDDWVSFTQGYQYQLGGGHHQVLYRKDGSQCIQVQPMVSGAFYEGDDFWVGTLGPVPPAIGIDQSSLEFNANIGGSNPANQTVAVSNTGDGTLPTLSVDESASWLTVSIQNNGTNSPSLVNSVDISGLGGDVYTTTVTISGNEVSSVQYTVQLTVVAPPVLDSITVTPTNAYVVPDGTQQYTAAGLDQYGDPFTLSGTTWTVSDGGTISGSGLFTAASTEGGPYTVTATVGSISGSTEVNVATTPPVHLKVNTGSNSTPVDGWESDASYVVSGNTGSTYDFTCGSIDLGGATDAAPNDVYATVRHTAHAYSFGDLADGTYTVRLHFMDQFGGDRAMDYTIEGQRVLDNYSITDAAGGTCAGVVEEFTVTVSDGNGLQIEASPDAGNDVFESGIEIIGGTTPSKPPVTVLTPNGGGSYAVGDTLTISWDWDTTINGGAAMLISVDGGENFDPIGPSSVPTHTEGSTIGSYKLVIPATHPTAGYSLVSDFCLIMVREYTLNHLNDVSDAVFSITNEATASDKAGLAGATKLCRIGVNQHSELSVTIRAPGTHEVRVFGLDGAVVAKANAAAPRTHTFNRTRVATGTYLVRVRAGGKTYEQAVTVVGKR